MILFFLFSLIVFLSLFIMTIKIGISPMPSLGKTKRQLLLLLPKAAEGVIYELGCGFGGLLLELGLRYPEKRVVGYELSHIPYLIAKLRTLGKKNVEVYRKNFLGQPLENPAFFVCYLFPKGMRLLEEKLRGRNALVYTHTFSFTAFEKVLELRVDDIYKSPVYIYRCS